mgnify:CR=1 FL=1
MSKGKKNAQKRESAALEEIKTIRAFYQRRKMDVSSLAFGTYQVSPRFDGTNVILLSGNGQKVYQTIRNLGVQDKRWREDIERGNLYIRQNYESGGKK